MLGRFLFKRSNDFSGVKTFVMGALGLIAMHVCAQTQVDAPGRADTPSKTVFVPQLKVGEATHKLLEMQARGTMASERQYPVPVEVSERIYQRYLQSFEHPIAEKSGSTLDALD